jgi:hypothetical protein
MLSPKAPTRWFLCVPLPMIGTTDRPRLSEGARRKNRIRRIANTIVMLVAAAMAGTQAEAQTVPRSAHPHLDLFLHVLRPLQAGSAPPLSQTKLEQVLRILPPIGVGHGSGPALSQSSPGAAAPPQDPSIYGFCYESCRTERAVGSCGTPAPGETGPPQQLCDPIDDTATLRAIIGPPLGAGASPFVDDNTGPDGAQPAGYTFLGQFVDHDTTRTTTALSALGALNQAAQSDAAVRTTLAAAGITPICCARRLPMPRSPARRSAPIPLSSTSTASTACLTSPR